MAFHEVMMGVDGFCHLKGVEQVNVVTYWCGMVMKAGLCYHWEVGWSEIGVEQLNIIFEISPKNRRAVEMRKI